MKKTLLLGLFLLIGFMVQAQNEITIDGKVANVKDGLVVTLVRFDGRVGKTIATDTIKSGSFYFELKLEKIWINFLYLCFQMISLLCFVKCMQLLMRIFK